MEINKFRMEVLPDGNEQLLEAAFDPFYIMFQDPEIVQYKHLFALVQNHHDAAHATEWNTVIQVGRYFVIKFPKIKTNFDQKSEYNRFGC